MVRTVATNRRPEPSIDQTLAPTRMSSTATSPMGVAIRVPRARQIGQFGGPAGACSPIVIAPSASIVPVVRWPTDAFGAGMFR